MEEVKPWIPQRKQRVRRIPLICTVCGIKKSSMSLKISPHEEYGTHTRFYCSACHRETFEQWYREQEEFRTGKWTGTPCLACTSILERCSWFDEFGYNGATCDINCHMIWHAYIQYKRGKTLQQAINTIINRSQDYPFDEEDI